MSSEPQEGSVREQLSAAEGTIVQNEEELRRQRRLLDSSWNPQLQLNIVVLPQHWMTEEENLCNQQRNFRVEQEPLQIKEELQEPKPPQIKEEQEEPEPPQIKEEQEEPEPPWIKEEQEEPEPPQIKEEPKEPKPPHIKEEPKEPKPSQIKEEQEEPEPLQIKEEQQNFNVTDSQDKKGNQHEESTSTTDEETDPQSRDQRKRRDRSHVQSVDSSHMSAALPQHWMTGEEDLFIQQRNFRVEQEEPERPQTKEEQEEPEPPQIKEEPRELCISQDEEHLDLKQETDTLIEIPTTMSRQVSAMFDNLAKCRWFSIQCDESVKSSSTAQLLFF
ncbi:uncharacterized protein LOC144987889 [Oryzias latipes]